MTLLVRKADDLILDARAITGADPVDLAAIQRRTVEVVEDDPFRLRRRPGDGAVHPVSQFPGCFKGEGHHRLLARLALQAGKIDAGPQNPGGGAGFEPAQGNPQPLQGIGQPHGGKQAVRSAVVRDISHEHPALQKRSRGKDDRFGGELLLQPGGQPPAVRQPLERDDLSLVQIEPRLPFKGVFHISRIGTAVDLGAQGMHCRTLAPVEHTGLEEGGVRRPAHFPTEGIHLPYQMAFGRAADRGIAGHVPHRVQVDGEHHRPAAQPGGSQGRLNPRVARPNDRHLIVSCVKLHPIIRAFPYPSAPRPAPAGGRAAL